MKILTTEEIRTLNNYTIVNEPVLSVDLTERAAKSAKRWIEDKLNSELRYHIFCGSGNNGADGLALARLLKKDGYQVTAYLVTGTQPLSLDCVTNKKRFLELSRLTQINEKEDLPELDSKAIVIDALFGTGLNRAVSGILQQTIDFINQLNQSFNQ